MARLRAVLRRFPRLLSGLVLCGAGVAFMVESDLGLPPWDVLHQGISFRTPLTIGQASIAVGLFVIVFWIPLRQVPGIGTIANAIVIGSTVDVVGAVMPDVETATSRWMLMLAGPVLMGLGSALYIGAGLGTGPRDGLMTGIAARGLSIRLTRTLIEGSALLTGWLLGGRFGAGTIVFAATVGPLVQFFIGRIPGIYLHQKPVEVKTGVGVA
jgi:uncharacterized membrane protein YczE